MRHLNCRSARDRVTIKRQQPRCPIVLDYFRCVRFMVLRFMVLRFMVLRFMVLRFTPPLFFCSFVLLFFYSSVPKFLDSFVLPNLQFRHPHPPPRIFCTLAGRHEAQEDL
ncbi:MAG TPA: hypothetical protein PKC19_09190, partial [Roseiflexaceae bacterium]|nr:hypothetical protein [Roseiflexaceae bacterium]